MSLGHGTTITFDSGFFGEVLSCSLEGVERAAVPTTHFGTSGGKTFIKGETYDPGELLVEIHYDETDSPPIDSAAETVTINWAGGADSTSFSGFMTGFEITAADEEKIRARCRVKASGNVTWTTP